MFELFLSVVQVYQMESGVNGPAGQIAVRRVLTMLTMLGLDDAIAAATTHCQLLTTHTLPVLGTVRSKNLVILYAVQVEQLYLLRF